MSGKQLDRKTEQLIEQLSMQLFEGEIFIEKNIRMGVLFRTWYLNRDSWHFKVDWRNPDALGPNRLQMHRLDYTVPLWVLLEAILAGDWKYSGRETPKEVLTAAEFALSEYKEYWQTGVRPRRQVSWEEWVEVREYKRFAAQQKQVRRGVLSGLVQAEQQQAERAQRQRDWIESQPPEPQLSDGEIRRSLKRYLKKPDQYLLQVLLGSEIQFDDEEFPKGTIWRIKEFDESTGKVLLYRPSDPDGTRLLVQMTDMVSYIAQYGYSWELTGGYIDAIRNYGRYWETYKDELIRYIPPERREGGYMRGTWCWNCKEPLAEWYEYGRLSNPAVICRKCNGIICPRCDLCHQGCRQNERRGTRRLGDV